MDLRKLKSKSLLLTLLLSILFGGLIIKNPPLNILSWDIYGHYLYLPSTFIYDDPYYRDMETYESLNEEYNNLDSFYILFDAENGSGNKYNKCPLGFSILMSPFFAVGHWLAPSFDYPQDGFSKPYQYSIAFGSWFYFTLGLFFLNAFLRKLFDEWLTILLILLVAFATNLGYYGVWGLGMVHGVIFGFYSMLIYFTMQWYKKPVWSNSIMLALVYGLMTLTRASEIIAIIIPLFWGLRGISRDHIQKRIQYFKAHFKQVLLIAGVIAMIGSLQMIYWKSCTGNWIIDSYNNPGEGFDFFPPHLVDYLFSYRKGLLIYTPLMVLCLAGFFFVWKNKREMFIIAVFGILNILLLSSWTCWWYAESFAQRSIVQSYPIYLIGLGALIEQVKKSKILWPITIVAIIGMTSLNLFQTWQFTKGIIHESRMTGKAYWSVFLKTSRPENFDDYLLVDDRQDPNVCIADTINYQIESSFVIDYEDNLPDGFRLSETMESNCIEINDEFIYSEMLTVPYGDVTTKQYSIFKVSARFYIEGNPHETRAALAFRVAHNEMYFQRYLVPHEIGDVVPGEWQTFSMTFFAPYVRNWNDNIEVFGWLMGSGRAYIDDIEVVTYRRVKDYY